MEMALTKNEGFFDKGCPGERLKTRVWFSDQLQAVRFPVVWDALMGHRLPRQSGPERFHRAGTPIASRARCKCSLGHLGATGQGVLIC